MNRNLFGYIKNPAAAIKLYQKELREKAGTWDNRWVGDYVADLPDEEIIVRQGDLEKEALRVFYSTKDQTKSGMINHLTLIDTEKNVKMIVAIKLPEYLNGEWEEIDSWRIPEDITFEKIRDYQKAFRAELQRLGFEKTFWPEIMGEYVVGLSNYVMSWKINKDPNKEYLDVRSFGGQGGRVNVGVFFKFPDIKECVKVVLDRQLAYSEEIIDRCTELIDKNSKVVSEIKEKK
nr:MAG TPA: hypothetical protein [Caudoviricetes sp.]